MSFMSWIGAYISLHLSTLRVLRFIYFEAGRLSYQQRKRLPSKISRNSCLQYQEEPECAHNVNQLSELQFPHQAEQGQMTLVHVVGCSL